MKIIHLVLGKANPERMNGVNKVAFHLAKNQHEMGYDVSVWGISNSLEHNYPARSFKTRLFRQRFNKLMLDDDLRQSIAWLPKDTVVHMHGAFITEFYLISRLLRSRFIPYIYTPHGSLTAAALEQSKYRKKIYFKFFEQELIRHAAAVQLLGEQEYAHLDQLIQNVPKLLIPNGMDLSEIPSIPEKPPESVPVFGFCGRLDAYHKGLDLLLQGFQLFLRRGNKGRLELIGDGPDRAKLERQAASLGIAEHVTFRGALYGAEKYRAMAAADLFLHPSRMEGFPMAVLEAAALNLPCLVSEPTSMCPYIQQFDAGIPLPSLQPLIICSALEHAAQLHQNKMLKPMGERAGMMVKETFNWKNVSAQLIHHYNTVQENN